MTANDPPTLLGPYRNDPAMTEAFERLCAKLVQISNRFDTDSMTSSSVERSPYAQDHRWLKEHIASGDQLNEAVGLFSDFAEFQVTRLTVAAHHVAAMKVLSKRLKQGYEVASSHARAVTTSAVSVRYAIGPTTTPEERITRLFASIYAQHNFSGRMQKALSDARHPGGAGNDEGFGENHDYLMELDRVCEAAGMDVVWDKRKTRRQAVKYGDYKSPFEWRLTAEAKKLGEKLHFAWLLTSGAAHVEPWAVTRFNEGTVDFYGAMGQSALCPAFTHLITDIGGYFGADVSKQIDELEVAAGRFQETLAPIYDRAMTRLPQDHPERMDYELRKMLEHAWKIIGHDEMDS